MPPIISHSERQKIESSPTQATGAQSLHPCVSIAFKSSQPPPVGSLTPPPPRHYLRNATSSEKRQVLIQKRSDIYTRAQQAQQEELESSHPCAQPPALAEARIRPKLLTRSSSFTFETSVSPWKTQITRSASWKSIGIAPGRRSNKSPTEVHVVEFESLGAQRRENMVLGLSEVDAHIKRLFDSEDGAGVATHSPARHPQFDPNRGELEYKSVLGFTATAEQKPVEIEMPVRDTQGLNHDSIPKLYQTAVDPNDDGTAASHHTQHLNFPSSNHSSTPHGSSFPQWRRARRLQRARQPKDSFPPPRVSSLVGNSLWLDPHASSSIAAGVSSQCHPHPAGFPADSVDPHTGSQNTNHKSHSKSGGGKAVSRAMRHLGGFFWSNACTSAREPSVVVHPSK